MKTSFWTYAEKYPPCLCRLLARHHNGPPYTTDELVARSVWLDAYEINSISHQLTWDTIPFRRMQFFLMACSVDFCDSKEMERIAAYLKLNRKFRYLSRSPEFETILRPLARRYWEHIGSKIK